MPSLIIQIPFIAALGWFSGIMVNYLSDILPVKIGLKTPVCLNCGTPQLLRNYLFWPRRCPACDQRRYLRVWIVELVYITAAIWMWLYPPANIAFTAGFIYLIYFGIVGIIDLEHRLIFYPSIAIGLILGLVFGIPLYGIIPTIIGGLCGFLIMLVLYLFGHLFVIFINRWRQAGLNEAAMGFGDVLLGAVIGLMVGFPGILSSLIISIIAAGLFSLAYMLVLLINHKYRIGIAFSYGPFLIIGAIYLLYF